MMTNFDENQKVAFCGIYCGSCPLYTGEMGETAEKFERLAAAAGFDQKAEFDPGMAWFTNFKKRLAWFKKEAVCGGCRRVGGRQFHDGCGLRQCCKDMKVDFCHNCGQYPCVVVEEFKTQAPDLEENLHKIKEVDMTDYIREQMGTGLPGI